MPVPPTFIPAVAVIARRRRILGAFEKAGADRPEKVRTLAELDVREGLLVSRMKSSGVLVTADGERYYVSAEGLAAWSRRRKRYVLTALISVTLLLGVVALVTLTIRR